MAWAKGPPPQLTCRPCTRKPIRYHALIQRFNERTGCPVIVNTSFNVHGETIIGTPEYAFRCFMGTKKEVLAISNCLLRKEDQEPKLTKDYKSAFELD